MSNNKEYQIADIDEKQEEEIHKLEKKLGLTLIAYDKYDRELDRVRD